jgi:hypothetical protein
MFLVAQNLLLARQALLQLEPLHQPKEKLLKEN